MYTRNNTSFQQEFSKFAVCLFTLFSSRSLFSTAMPVFEGMGRWMEYNPVRGIAMAVQNFYRHTTLGRIDTKVQFQKIRVYNKKQGNWQ